MNDFDTFWTSYPKKLAKLDAIKAYTRARRTTSAADILAGVLRYVANLPDEQRFIAHAGSWLRAGRWLDEYDPPIVATTASDWWEDCKLIHGGSCVKRWDHEIKKRA